MSIRENLERVRERIATAARRANRNPEEVQLLAVSKTFAADSIREAYEAGQRLFGENRVQEFAEKHPALAGLRGAQWHMIGHLQSNKAKHAVELFDAVDSLDSVALGDKLNQAAGKAKKLLPVLVELNVGGEESKSGLRPDSSELDELLDAAAGWEHLGIRGLMTVPPFDENPERARPFFRVLAQYRDRIAARNLPRVRMEILSMGMSHDFEVAIEEGSTCVRIGTAIFGARPMKA
ncbi:MAG: YggS family pyridoxal phosphate-dependent enzyme [Terriglobales bacterium]